MSEARISASLTRSTLKLIYLSVSLIGFSRTVQALIDSGATLNFIHEALVSSLGLTTESCPPVKVRLADGRVLSHANRKVTLKFTIAGIPQIQIFYVAPIGQHSVILGMPWLESVNPHIDWRRKKILSYDDISEFTPSPPSPNIPIVEPPKSRKSRKSQNSRKPHTPPLPKPLPSPPKVCLTRRINSNDQIYFLHIDSIDSHLEVYSLPEYLATA